MFGPNAKQISNESLKALGKTHALLPTVHEVAKAIGKRVRYRTLKDGRREAHVPFKTNDGHGRLTKEAQIVHDMMKPFMQADVARVAEANGFPGGWGGRGKRKDARTDGSPACRVFCRKCDRLLVWCECGGAV